MPTGGGAIVEIPIALPGYNYLMDVSLDGTNLLILNVNETYTEARTWIVRAIDGVPLRPLLEGGSNHAFSPDGRFVAYVDEGCIWVVGTDGTGAHKIAASDGSNLAWSPDGKRIRFSKGLPEWSLWEVGADGSNLHKMLIDPNHFYWQCCGRWTADGNFYVFLGQTKSSVAGEIWAVDERRGVLRRPPLTPVRLASGPTRWVGLLPAKDANTLYAEAAEPRGQLVRLDARTKQFQPFLGGMSAMYASFSPDGRSVLYITYPDRLLFRANADGSNPVQLTGWEYSPNHPTWSPDGSQILFSTSYPGGIFVLPAAGGTPKRVLPDDGEPRMEGDATWSPDGKKIAFAAFFPYPEQQKDHIRVVDLATKAVKELAGSEKMFYPRWSPNGRYIATLHIDGRSLQVFDNTEQKWKTVLENAIVLEPNWSHDGEWLYFETQSKDKKWSISRIRVAGGKLETVEPVAAPDEGVFLGWFGLDSSDAMLSTQNLGRNQMYTITLSER
jgi:Tol biopolymer transport system component